MTAPAADRARKKALDDALRGMFATLRARPIPDRILSVVEQLDAPAEPAARSARGR